MQTPFRSRTAQKRAKGGRWAAPTDEAARAFSSAAQYYDREQHANYVAGWSRRENLKILRRYFAPGSRLLEVGCGTGEEAIALSQNGCTIVATDAAPGMIHELARKLEGNPYLTSRIQPIVLPARHLRILTTLESQERQFEGAYSSFGPLNCEADLRPVVSALSQLVQPGGYVLLSFINRMCPWEIVWHLLKGDARSAFRRFPRRTLATVRTEWQETRVPVYYRSLSELVGLFRRDFYPVEVRSLPWLLPPQYLSPVVERSRSVARLLGCLDAALASRWPFNRIGDHVVIVMRRRNRLGPPPPPAAVSRLRRLARWFLGLRYRGFKAGEAPSRWVRSLGRKLWVAQGVFDPRLHYTSEYFASYLAGRGRKLVENRRVLDLGTGTGLLAVAAAEGGAKCVMAVDINPGAVLAAQINALVSGLTSKVSVSQSDFFSAVRGEKFDVIITNPPYFRGEPQGYAERAYFAGSELDWFVRLAEEAPLHLSTEGKIVMVVGDAAPVSEIMQPFADRGWQIERVAHKHFIAETVVIYELRPAPSLVQ
jgi:HemK-related putative methylase